MQFIDKSTQREQTNQLIIKFLNANWFNFTVNNRTRNIDYTTKGLFSKQLRDNFVPIFLEEQQNYCCYCMKRIDNNNRTFEHIIPRDRIVSRQDLAFYQQFEPLNCVILQEDFKETAITVPLFPHEIAADNLVLSCEGRFGTTQGKAQTCNHFRGNNKIIPLFYIQNINRLVSYKKGGFLVYDDTDTPTIDVLNLNHERLQSIRNLWASFVDLELSISYIFNPKNRKIILDDCFVNGFITEKIYQDFDNEILWNMMLEFDWFFNYYSKTL